MPRSARLDIPGLLHHVIVRGIERRPIFRDDQDHAFLVKRFACLLQETGTECLAWSLLTNHFHLLLRPSYVGLATFMRRLLTSYAVTFNLRHDRSGHLFQNRYKSLLCDEESYFFELVRYIHLNPLRAGLVENLEELDVYPWCGHAVVLGNRSLPGQLPGEVLNRFGHSTKRQKANYRSFIADGLAQKNPSPDSHQGLRRWLAKQLGQEGDLATDGRVLGSEDFLQTVQPAQILAPEQISLPRLLSRVAEVFEVAPEMLQRRTRLARVAEARSVLCFLAVQEGNHSGAEVARLLSMSRAGVTLAIRRGEVMVGERAELRKILAN